MGANGLGLKVGGPDLAADHDAVPVCPLEGFTQERLASALVVHLRGVELVDAVGDGGPDGPKIDRARNVYTTGPGGIHVFAPDAAYLGVIHVPEVIANFTWGGDDLRTLFATASTSLYRARVNVPGNKAL